MNTLFEEAHIGPLTLRNRSIRSAAFESMCPGHVPTQQLYDYHTSVARGGIGMTTIAYAAVTESGLSFDRQLVMCPEIVPGLRHLTDGIHAEGAAAGIQLGHCGNMSHREICGCTPVGASTGFNLYSPTLVRGLRADELPALAKCFGRATRLAMEAGFDSVEIHCGHGYLIDQFLNPFFNHRHDEYGGSLENRMRFMTMCMEEVMKAARVANAQEFIEQMPEGYQTNIGEGGSRLSGGQRQRVSIARAILKNPPILILDEATSALDTEAERQVQQALNNVMRGRTTLVIAHRLSTTVDADEILVVEHGQIVERGTHQELLRQQGRYSQLVEMQSLHDGSNAATEQE